MLTSNEYRFLSAPNGNISLVVRVTGPVTESAFQAAVRKARYRHPLLGVRIRYDEAHQGWFVSKNVPANPIRTVSRTGDDQWVEELQKEHRIYLDPTGNPLVRFVLLLEKQITDFIIFAEHAVCDGMSLSILARDIVQYLSDPQGPSAAPLVPVPFDPEHATVPLRVGGLVEAVMKTARRKWQASPVYFTAEEFRTLHAAFWRKYSYNLVYKRLSEAETSTLVENCRAHGVTVNTALCTAFSAAIHAVHSKHRKYMDALAVAVDLRDKLRIEQKDFFQFSASGISPRFCYNFRSDFWTNARRLHGRIRRQLRSRLFMKNLGRDALMSHSMLDAMYMAGLGSALRAGDPHYEKISGFRRDGSNVIVRMLRRKGVLEMAENQIALVCTNLGRTRYPADSGQLRIQAMIFTPSSGLLMECVLGVITIGGRLNLTAGNITDRDSREQLEKLTQIALRFLT